MNKSICYISPVSIHSTRWVEAFHKKGYDVSLITDFQTWVAQKPTNVPIYVLPTLILNNVHRRLVPNYVVLGKTLKQIDPDLVHLHTQHHYAPVLVQNHIPFILHSWGLEILELSKMSIFRQILARYVATKARKIIVDAGCMKKIWMSVGIPEEKIDVIPFGVNTEMFNPKANGSQIREKLEIDQKEVLVISTRPFFPHYDLKCLIKAIPLVLEKRKNVKFIIKGKGPLESSLRELARKFRVDQHILFSGPVPYHEMPQYLTAADIYVSTSIIDSTSVSLLEAMACGLPPITTDIAGNREWIRNGVNGLLYPPKDHVALAEKIVHLADDKEMRKRFGERNSRLVVERAEWRNCVSKMEAIYNAIA